MENRIRKYVGVSYVMVFILTPILIYVFGDFPRRSVAKEVISVITIVSFFVMLGMFYISRLNRSMLHGLKMKKLLDWHKVLGYIFVAILLLHPFFLVIPKYFDSGITPGEAFNLLLSNYDNIYVCFGIIAWVLMLLIGVLSMIRKKLPIPYKVWRTIHGSLSVVFISLASIHAISLGRHMDTLMIIVIAILAVMAISLLLSKYMFKNSKINN